MNDEICLQKVFVVGFEGLFETVDYLLHFLLCGARVTHKKVKGEQKWTKLIKLVIFECFFSSLNESKGKFEFSKDEKHGVGAFVIGAIVDYDYKFTQRNAVDLILKVVEDIFIGVEWG